MSGQFRENWKRMAAKDANRYSTGDDKDVVRFQDAHLLTTNASGLNGLLINSATPTDGQAFIYNSLTGELVASGITLDTSSIVADIATVSGLIGSEIAGIAVESGTPNTGDGILYDGAEWSFSPYGKVIQHAYSETSTYASSATVIAFDNSAPTSSDGTSATTVSITPKFATSKIFVEAQAHLSNDSDATVTALLCIVGSSTIAAASETVAASGMTCVNIRRQFDAATTVTKTIELRWGGDTGTTEINGARGGAKLGGMMRSYIKVYEIVA